MLHPVACLREWRSCSGTRLVRCPETDPQEWAAVELDARSEAIAALVGRKELRVEMCSRCKGGVWCLQECLDQVERDPAGTLVRNIARHWHRSAGECALCGRSLAREREPAFLESDGATRRWDSVPPEALPELLPSWPPVCSRCHAERSAWRRGRSRDRAHHRAA